MDREASSGKLDFLISEAAEDRKQGRLIDWPVRKLTRGAVTEFVR
jgi:hypothetical protein